jgi:septum formation protein
VITGVSVVAPGFEKTEAEVTQVWFSQLSDAEIADYVRSGEPMDKAGAYGIQGIASRWIGRIEGCYFNVVGLPVQRVYRLLRAAESETGQTLL